MNFPPPMLDVTTVGLRPPCVTPNIGEKDSNRAEAHLSFAGNCSNNRSQFSLEAIEK
jgi:hypothetical protein